MMSSMYDDFEESGKEIKLSSILAERQENQTLKTLLTFFHESDGLFLFRDATSNCCASVFAVFKSSIVSKGSPDESTRSGKNSANVQVLLCVF